MNKKEAVTDAGDRLLFILGPHVSQSERGDTDR